MIACEEKRKVLSASCTGSLESMKPIFGYPKLSQNLMEKPATNLGITVHGNGCCASIWMFPARVTSLLACLREAKLLSCSLEFARSSGHPPLQPSHLEAEAFLPPCIPL